MKKTPEKLAYIEEMLDTYGLDKFRTAVLLSYPAGCDSVQLSSAH